MGLDLSLPVDDRWLPKSILCLRDYNLTKFSKDVIAGITVGLVALPLAMAFSIASGLTPITDPYRFIAIPLGDRLTWTGPLGSFSRR